MALQLPKLEDVLRAAPNGISASASTTQTIYEEVAWRNAVPGKVNDCPICLGKRVVWYVDEEEMAARTRDCVCEIRRRSRERIRKSGLEELYTRCTLERFDTALPWQAGMKARAEAYIAGQRGWLYVSGRSGSGKTHILFAIAGALIAAGLDTRHFLWREQSVRLKAMVNTPEYAEEMQKYIDCQVLVIDDFWKGGDPSPADVSLAYELLNARYNVPSLLTLISSERPLNAVCNIDEAIGSRIVERARGYVLETGDVNMRLVG